MPDDILPFGKYAGQPLEVLAEDPSYKDWLLNTPWFKTKYPAQYNIIINNFAAPADTPEHNRLQAKFLDESLIERLVRLHRDFPAGLPLEVLQPKFETEGWDVFVGVKGATFCWLDKERNTSWTTTDYKSKDESGFVWGEFTGRVDNIFGFKDHRLYYARLCSEYEATTYGIELKPTLGDDYPSVLRQVKRHGKCDFRMLVVDKFNATSVTYEQVQAMFEGDGITVILLGELENNPIRLTKREERLVNGSAV